MSSLSEPDLKIVYQGVYEFTDLYGNGKYNVLKKKSKYKTRLFKRLKENIKIESTTSNKFFYCLNKKFFSCKIFEVEVDSCYSGQLKFQNDFDLIKNGKITGKQYLIEIEKEKEKENELAEQKQFEDQNKETKN